MFDKNLLFRDGTSALSATANSTALNVGPDVEALTYEVIVPTAPTGTSPTLDIKIQESADNSTWIELGVFAQITAAGTYRRKMHSTKAYRRLVFTLGGTTPNFGNVFAALTVGGRDNKIG